MFLQLRFDYFACFVLLVFPLLYLVSRKKSTRSQQKPLRHIETSGKFDENEANEGDDLQPFLPERNDIPYVGATVRLSGGVDQFFEMVNNRRSVRKYSRREVDIGLVERCIQCAGTSPSGAHTQPWTFCVVSSAEMKQTVRDVVEAEEYTNYAKRMSRQWITDLKPLKTDHVKEYLTDAPHLVLIFKQVWGRRSDGGKQQHYYNELSVSIAVGILLSAFQSAGLCSLVTTPLNCGPALRTILERPENEKLLFLLPVGYPAKDCQVPDLMRKSLDELVVRF